MFTILDMAKSLTTRGLDCGQNRQDFEEEIAKRAEAWALRRPGDSSAQLFTRYATSTDDGRLLFKAAMMAKPRPQAAQDLIPTRDRPEPTGPAAAALDKIVSEFRDKYNRETTGRKISRQQAYARVIDDPENRRLRDAVRREEQEASLRIQQLRQPIWAAEESFEADFRLGRSPASARM